MKIIAWNKQTDSAVAPERAPLDGEWCKVDEGGGKYVKRQWNDPKPMPPAYEERLISTEKFLRRLTKNKLGKVIKLAENNDDLRGMLFILQSKPFVDLNSEELDSDLQWLVTAGVITQADKDSLLA